VGPQLPPRAGTPWRRAASVLLLAGLVLVLSGCDAFEQDQWARLAMPEPATEQAPHIFLLWRWAWVAAMATGVIVWGLMFWAMWRYRRRDDSEVPVQTRYNLPLEVFYTIAPVLMVVVFFFWTVKVQDEVLAMEPEPDVTVEVVGQQWSWTFNHGLGERNSEVDPIEGDFAHDEYAYTSGTASQIPTLVLPVDQTVHFDLWSPDVIHNFGIDSFLFKMDVIPGRVNQFQVTPTEIGTYNGKCFELCGTYHSRMLFNVEVVSQEDYAAYLETLETSDTPLLGGADAYTQAGLESDDEEGSSE
jgi:cytochrome c oxidase subunit II